MRLWEQTTHKGIYIPYTLTTPPSSSLSVSNEESWPAFSGELAPGTTEGRKFLRNWKVRTNNYGGTLECNTIDDKIHIILSRNLYETLHNHTLPPTHPHPPPLLLYNRFVPIHVWDAILGGTYLTSRVSCCKGGSDVRELQQSRFWVFFLKLQKNPRYM